MNVKPSKFLSPLEAAGIEILKVCLYIPSGLRPEEPPVPAIHRRNKLRRILAWNKNTGVIAVERKTIRKWKLFWAWQDHEEEIWLREMSQQGYHLSRRAAGTESGVRRRQPDQFLLQTPLTVFPAV